MQSSNYHSGQQGHALRRRSRKPAQICAAWGRATDGGHYGAFSCLWPSHLEAGKLPMQVLTTPPCPLTFCPLTLDLLHHRRQLESGKSPLQVLTTPPWRDFSLDDAVLDALSGILLFKVSVLAFLAIYMRV